MQAIAQSATHAAGAKYAGGSIYAGSATHSAMPMRSSNPNGFGRRGFGRRRPWVPRWGRGWGGWGGGWGYPYSSYATAWVPQWGVGGGAQCFYGRQSGELNCSGKTFPAKVLQVSGTQALVESPAVFSSPQWVPVL